MDPTTILWLMVLAVVLIFVLGLLGGWFFKVEQAQVVLVERLAVSTASPAPASIQRSR